MTLSWRPYIYYHIYRQPLLIAAHVCLQVYQLQQEKKKLQEDFSQLLKEREQLEERCTSYEHEKIQLGPRLEETKWEVSSRSTGAACINFCHDRIYNVNI